MQTEPGLRASGGAAPGRPEHLSWADASPFRALLAGSAEAIAIMAADGRIIWLSPAIERLLGYRADELLGASGSDIVHPDDIAEVSEVIAACAAGDTTRTIRTRCRHRDGSWRVFETRHTNLLHEPGVRGIVGNTRDITERVEAEQALQSSVESFRALAAEAPVGIVFTDAETRVTFVNDRWLEITGLSRDEVCGRSCWERITHPEDLEAVAAHAFEALERDGRADFECRVVRPDGSAVSVRGHAIEVRGADGKPISYVSSMEDVTAEREARDRAARWGALLHHSHDMVSMYDSDARFVFVSPSHERVLGYTVDELIGTSPIDFLHPDEREDVARAIAEQLRGDGHPTPVEHRFLHNDGSWRYLESVVVDLRTDPAINGILVNARDITDRRRVELVAGEQARILDGVARGVPLHATLDAVVEMIERWMPGGRGAVTRLDPDDGALRVAAAPNLDSACVDALEGLSVGQEVKGDYPARFYVVALGTDQRFLSATTVLRERGFRSCWGCPVDDPTGTRRIGGVMTLRRDDVEPNDADRSIMELAAALAAVAVERDQASSRLAHQARHDALTGLPNRQLVVQRLHRIVSGEADDGTHSAVLFLDVDRFKWLNDSVGHDAGDRLLVEMGARLQRALRPGDLVSRFGGDEFVMICERIESPAAAVEVGERVLDIVREPFTVDGSELVVTASIGIALVDDRPPEALLRDADAAMYWAKDRGRARVELFDEHMREKAVTRLDVERELRRALEVGGLVLHYQPVVFLESGQVAGFEALLRWDHPTRGLLYPADFLSIAEECGLIRPIGNWVREQAYGQAARWHARYPQWGKFVMGANLSAGELLDPNLGENIANTIERCGYDPGFLSIEITERLFFEDEGPARALFAQLHQLGVLLALDDFGTGYSPLVHLKEFPVHTIKIDRSFVSGLGVDPFDDAIVESVVDLAARLGLFAIAEGVETAEQADHLRRIGCACAQGYLFSHALPVDEIELLMGELPGPMFLAR
jgi:diguanylate cyclase (GGDEF)-like protein/PAS domain S-box-containing protein